MRINALLTWLAIAALLSWSMDQEMKITSLREIVMLVATARSGVPLPTLPDGSREDSSPSSSRSE